jgi:xylulose-5-phosphate/fructose-6-phosphate phosphoketolase
MGKFFKQFSFPGGIPSHVAPETPGSMHEGGELGYSLSHAYGAVLDKPNLVIACVVGDGEAETGPLATSWHANKFLNPKTDGVVLPILHLNGFKIDNPTILDRIPDSELKSLFIGYGYEPLIVEGSDPGLVHPAFAKTLNYCADKIKGIKEAVVDVDSKDVKRPTWPMIILRTPKGWTGPKQVDGIQIEGSYRSHQVPMASPKQNPSHLSKLEAWLMSYKPHELFDEEGKLLPELKALVPPRELRMGKNPYTNPRYKPLILPDYGEFGIEDPERGSVFASDATHLGYFLKRVVELNAKSRNFRIFGPDETRSNKLGAGECLFFSLFAPLLCFDSIDKLTYLCLLRQYLMSQPNSFLEKYAIAMTVCCHQMAELWKCSVNISARVGSRDICCLEDMDYSTLMKHLSTLSPVCSTNTQSG